MRGQFLELENELRAHFSILSITMCFPNMSGKAHVSKHDDAFSSSS